MSQEKKNDKFWSGLKCLEETKEKLEVEIMTAKEYLFLLLEKEKEAEDALLTSSSGDDGDNESSDESPQGYSSDIFFPESTDKPRNLKDFQELCEAQKKWDAIHRPDLDIYRDQEIAWNAHVKKEEEADKENKDPEK